MVPGPDATGDAACRICTGETFDREFGRAVVWQDELWRLSTSLRAKVVGFSYLEPHRHIPTIAELDGPEAATFGPTLARVSRLIRELADADIVYALLYGDHVRHLHVNLVPRRAGDPFVDGPLHDPSAPDIPAEVHEAFVTRLRDALAGTGRPQA